jgi:hypothetical protein
MVKLLWWRWVLTRHPLSLVMSVTALLTLVAALFGEAFAGTGWFVAFILASVQRFYRPNHPPTFTPRPDDDE